MYIRQYGNPADLQLNSADIADLFQVLSSFKAGKLSVQTKACKIVQTPQPDKTIDSAPLPPEI